MVETSENQLPVIENTQSGYWQLLLLWLAGILHYCEHLSLSCQLWVFLISGLERQQLAQIGLLHLRPRGQYLNGSLHQ